MEMSVYQSSKLVLLNLLNLSKDAVHIHIGLAVFLASVMIWKKGCISRACLIPVFFVAILMEILDLIDDINTLGYPRFSASLHDLINTVFWPVALSGLAFLKNMHDNKNASGQSSDSIR